MLLKKTKGRNQDNLKATEPGKGGQGKKVLSTNKKKQSGKKILKKTGKGIEVLC